MDKKREPGAALVGLEVMIQTAAWPKTLATLGWELCDDVSKKSIDQCLQQFRDGGNQMFQRIFGHMPRILLESQGLGGA